MEWLIGLAVALAVTWVAMVAFLWFSRPQGDMLQEAMRLLPDILRLLKRLATDPEVPRGAKVRLWLLFVYLAMPIDLVPDFLPVIGYADDAIIVAAVLRSVVRRAGLSRVRENWPGSADGLAALERLAGLS